MVIFSLALGNAQFQYTLGYYFFVFPIFCASHRCILIWLRVSYIVHQWYLESLIANNNHMQAREEGLCHIERDADPSCICFISH
jgi:hypothetical protein